MIVYPGLVGLAKVSGMRFANLRLVEYSNGSTVRNSFFGVRGFRFIVPINNSEVRAVFVSVDVCLRQGREDSIDIRFLWET